MAERGYVNVEGLPDGVIPLPADALVEVWIGGKNYRVPYGELGGIPASHAPSHRNGGADEIANSTPGAGVIPKADGNGTLNEWIAPASASLAGKVMLAENGEASATKAVSATDSRLTNTRRPTAHGASHVNGVDQIPNATPTSAGLMSAADKAAFDAYDPTNMPSDNEKAALVGSYGIPGATNPYLTAIDPRLEAIAFNPLLAFNEETQPFGFPLTDIENHGGTIYATGSPGDLYKGIGLTLYSTGQTQRSYSSLCSHNGELYVFVYGGDVYKLDGSNILQPTGQTSRNWAFSCVHEGELYAIADGKLYKMNSSEVFELASSLNSSYAKGIESHNGELLLATSDATSGYGIWRYAEDLSFELYIDTAIKIVNMYDLDGTLYLNDASGNVYTLDEANIIHVSIETGQHIYGMTEYESRLIACSNLVSPSVGSIYVFENISARSVGIADGEYTLPGVFPLGVEKRFYNTGSGTLTLNLPSGGTLDGWAAYCEIWGGDYLTIERVSETAWEVRGGSRVAGRGTVIEHAGATVPWGWGECDGHALSRTTHARLFSIIGTTFGVGDGSTTFNVPDKREVVSVGIGERASGVVVHDVFTQGQLKDDQFADHGHEMGLGGQTGAESWTATNYPNTVPQGGFYTGDTDKTQTNTVVVGKARTITANPVRSGAVTRSKSIGARFLIKY